MAGSVEGRLAGEDTVASVARDRVDPARCKGLQATGMIGIDPLATSFVPPRSGPEATADAIPGLEDLDRRPEGLQGSGSVQSCRPRANDAYVQRPAPLACRKALIMTSPARKATSRAPNTQSKSAGA